ncbi:MAG: hypothetical protein KKD64_15380 [Alphaproteobacteria bacterium]|nr:hypothetical protein [Alphaproteobacteria bacterium]MBU0876129.1 hypothetical protein [Alphaproteobacteria bacterium]MBU1771020.1 hypothetical protein [Alphaproteobacteria bacterium]
MTDDEACIGELLQRIGIDLAAANELQRIAARYLKARELMPDELADYIAHAFIHANAATDNADGRKVVQDRIARLAHGLGMSRNEGRPRVPVSKFDLALTVAQHGEVFSETTLKRTLARAYGISESTARTRIKEAKRKVAEAYEWLDAVMVASAIDCLVEPRIGRIDRTCNGDG